MKPTRETLTARAKWYAEGCPGLEDGDRYASSGDLARDAATDLEAALALTDHVATAVLAIEAEVTFLKARAEMHATNRSLAQLYTSLATRQQAVLDLLRP